MLKTFDDIRHFLVINTLVISCIHEQNLVVKHYWNNCSLGNRYEKDILSYNLFWLIYLHLTRCASLTKSEIILHFSFESGFWFLLHATNYAKITQPFNNFRNRWDIHHFYSIVQTSPKNYFLIFSKKTLLEFFDGAQFSLFQIYLISVWMHIKEQIDVVFKHITNFRHASNSVSLRLIRISDCSKFWGNDPSPP